MMPEPTSQPSPSNGAKKKPQVDLADAGDTAPIPESSQPPRVQDVVDPHLAGKHSTSRIHLSDSQQVAPNEDVPTAKPITQRIAMGRTGPISGELAKNMTVPMDFTDMEKPDGKNAFQQAVTPSVLNRTARITIEEEEDEVPTGGEAPKPVPATPALQPKTVKLARPGGAGGPTTTPRTIVLKRPEQPGQPKTVVLKKPEGTVQPKTVVLKKPGAAPAEAKGSTARIDVPAGEPAAPTTQRKTIRIKRPDGQEMAAPASGTFSNAAVLQAKAEARAALLERRSREPGPFILIVGIAATLVIGATLYLTAAHYPTPEVPMKKLPMPEPMIFVN